VLLGGWVLFPAVAFSEGPAPPEAKMESKDLLSLARQYAPILWLAPDEPAYPMLPFPFAFDGIDNDEDGLYDLEDRDEVNALYIAKGQDMKERLESLEKLLERLRKLRIALRDGSRTPREEAEAQNLLVRGTVESRRNKGIPSKDRCEDPKDQFKDFKLCEEFAGAVKCGPTAAVLVHYKQGVTRDDVKAKNLANEPLSALQYWMYYPWDDEHLHDGEHVSVFFTANRVEAVVGAGHVPSTANNVLAHIAGVPYPSEIPTHIPILVEMGKHSSAPDLNCNGIFDVGQDSNWLPAGAWGTRDINYAVGRQYFTKFERIYSFDRTRGTMLVDSEASGRDYVTSCSDHSLGGAILRDMGFPQPQDRGQAYYSKEGPASPGGLPLDRHLSIAYTLIDADLLSCVFATKPRNQRTPELCVSATKDLEQRLFDMRNELFPSDRNPLWKSAEDVLLDAAFRAQLEEFRTAGRSGEPRADIWNHSDYAKYDNDFKAALFRRIALGLSFTVENGNSRYGVYLRWAPRGKDSSFDLQVWVDRFPCDDPIRNQNLPQQGFLSRFPLEAALLYNSFSTSYNGLYAGFSVRSRDLRYTRQFVVPSDKGASSGESLVVRTRHDTNIFVEAGYAFAIPLDKVPGIGKPYIVQQRPLQLRLGVAGPLLWGTAPRTAAERGGGGLRASKWPEAVELRLTVQIRLGNFGKQFHGHPLDKNP
jgi:hypothetical protein